MTRAKLVLMMCKIQNYFFGLMGQDVSAEAIELQNVFSSMVEFMADPSKENHDNAKMAFCRFLNIFTDWSNQNENH